MTHGLVLGKFMPLHNGHLALIDHAKKYCRHVTVLLCTEDTESIPADLRLQWLREAFEKDKCVDVVHFAYDKDELPNSSVSSMETSILWARAVKSILPTIDCIVSSEPYGDFVASELGISSLLYDAERNLAPVSGSQIRERPFTYWSFIPAVVRPYFVKKISLVGTESTGKSTLTAQLAAHFNTSHVEEVARDIVPHTNEVTFENLDQIAHAHAEAIKQVEKVANKLLFVDTDITITQSYARFLFKKELEVSQFILETNRMDLYLFLNPDCPFVQDGTRLSESDRLALSGSHRDTFLQKGVQLNYIGGNWTERFEKAKLLVENLIARY